MNSKVMRSWRVLKTIANKRNPFMSLAVILKSIYPISDWLSRIASYKLWRRHHNSWNGLDRHGPSSFAYFFQAWESYVLAETIIMVSGSSNAWWYWCYPSYIKCYSRLKIHQIAPFVGGSTDMMLWCSYLLFHVMLELSTGSWCHELHLVDTHIIFSDFKYLVTQATCEIELLDD